MQKLTEMTKTGDPMLRLKLPKAIHQAIFESAKNNKRRPQDEFIKLIVKTFRADAKFQEVQNRLLLELKEIYHLQTNTIRKKTMKSVKKAETANLSKGIALFAPFELKELVKFAQVIPESMMQELKKTATEKGIAIELEVALRLLVTLLEPDILGDEPLSQKILNQDFSIEEAIRECELNHERWLYPYELKKLELFLEFQGKLPRKFKESFVLIDVKKESKRILAEIQNKKKNSKGEE